jgi:hypothetical protein
MARMLSMMWRGLVALGLVLAAYVGAAADEGMPGRDRFPGGSPTYSFGVAQSPENFANVRYAEVAEGLYPGERYWGRFGPGVAPGTQAALTRYFPFSVRWELKDGRQFLLENIDVRAIMREYFRDPRNHLVLPWQREGRPRAAVGDMDPALVYEVKDDVLRLKWLLTINRTPVGQRLLPTGEAAPWDLVYEEHLVKEIPGVPVQGIDFGRWWGSGPDIHRVR